MGTLLQCLHRQSSAFSVMHKKQKNKMKQECVAHIQLKYKSVPGAECVVIFVVYTSRAHRQQ